MKFYSAVSVLALLPLALTGWATASAQERSSETAAGQEASRVLDTVTVTVLRRDEDLMDVPAAVSAFTPDTLQERGVVRLEELSVVTPSFQSSRFVGRPDATSFGIRGQRLNDIRVTNDPSVVTYVAEVPQMRPFGLGVLGFLDVASVEIVKGPQGTLFGRNATGGAVLITPNAPTDEFSGNARLRLGNYNRVNGEVVLNGAIADGVSGRLALTGGHRDGWLENRGPFGDLLSESFQGARASLRFDPGEAVESIFYADYLNFESSGQGGSIVAANPQGIANFFPLGTGGAASAALQEQQASDFFSTRTSADPFIKTEVAGISNTTTWNLNDNWLVKNIVGYRKVKANVLVDVDGTAVSILETLQGSDTSQFSEELQLQYNADRMNLILGAFYFNEDGEDGGIGYFFQGLAPLKFFNQSAENTSYSLFAEGTYDLTPQFSVTAGLRQTWDEREFTSNIFNGPSCAVVDAFGIPFPNCTRTESVEYDKLTWNLTGQYRLSDTHQVYASLRRGYRSGGFNIGSERDAQFAPYRPETVDAVEVGYKGDFNLGGAPLRIASAVFFSDYSDIQKSINRCVVPATGGPCSLQTAIENAAAATINGFEFEAVFEPTTNLQLSGFYSYIDASYDEWNSQDAGGNTVDLSNNQFGYLSENKAGGSIRYYLPFSAPGDIIAQLTASYQSEQQLDEFSGPGVMQDGYTLLNARLSWEDFAGRKGVTAALWVNNLTNEKYYIGTNNVYASAGFTSAYKGEPLMFGIDLGIDF